MKRLLIPLLLLSLALAGCVVEPGGGYGNRGYGNRGWENQHHGEFHGDGDQNRVWVR